MRRSFGLIMTVGALLTAAPSHAQTFDPRYPVCMHVYSGANEGGGEWYDCSFTSLPQCRTTASTSRCAPSTRALRAAPPAAISIHIIRSTHRRRACAISEAASAQRPFGRQSDGACRTSCREAPCWPRWRSRRSTARSSCPWSSRLRAACYRRRGRPCGRTKFLQHRASPSSVRSDERR